MKNPEDGFEGIDEPTATEDQVKESPVEKVQIELYKERERSKIRQGEKWESYKRLLAALIIGVGIIGFLALLVFKETALAKEWWAAIGVLVGYLVRVLFVEAKKVPDEP